MATFLSADRTTTYTLAAEEDLVLLPDIEITSSGTGISVASGTNSGHSLALHGSVFGSGAGIVLSRAGNTVPFRNFLDIAEGGSVTGMAGDGITSTSDRIRIENDGSISSLGTSTSDHGLDLFGNIEIVNTGNISAASGDAARLQTTALVEIGAPLLLENSGLIAGGSNGLTVSGLWLNGSNSGTISGRTYGISMGGTDARMTLTNSGRIFGGSGTAITATALDDLLQNTGVIEGSVDLGGGADGYLAAQDGVVLGVVFGGIGEDLLSGAAAEDALDGGEQADRLWGRGGDDVLIGGDASDELRGGSGDDELRGDAGRDLIWGGGGDDVVTGGSGADRLRGGGGEDVFLFRQGDSGLGSGADVIGDFRRGEDLIDLSLAAPGEFVLGDITGSGPELRLTQVGDDMRVEADRDGNGSVDFEIWVRNLSGLSAGDFVL